MPPAVLPVALSVEECAHQAASCFPSVQCVSWNITESDGGLNGSVESNSQLCTLQGPFDKGLLENP